MDNSTDFVNVAVRIKPSFSHDSSVSNLKVVSNNPPTICVTDRQSFTFDHIFDGDADQGTIFNDIIQPMLDKFLLGYNCTVFAYGQTGTGKTYTMENPQNTSIQNMGMISRTFNEIFENDNADMEISTEVSLYEIYNEKVFDLLDDKRVPLPVKGFTIPDITKVAVGDLGTAQELFTVAAKNRTTAGTLQNAKSSRSHAIYTLHSTITSGDSIKTSKFNFVDLAGSESVRKTGSEGNTFHEGVNINKGLLCLGQVINALCSNQKYIPYRQAIITSILKDSLSKTNYITLLACISSKINDTTETLQTLDFARRVKKIASKPEVQSMVDNSFKKPMMDMSKLVTPIKPLRPVQTSTAFKVPRPGPMIATYTPGEAMKRQFAIALEETGISISPIIRRCVQQMESKLATTVDLLLNEKTRHIRGRSPRTLCHKCDETIINENEESIIHEKKKKSQSQRGILMDSTSHNIICMDNDNTMNSSGDCNNLKAQNSYQTTSLLKEPSDPPTSMVRRRSQRLLLKQTTSSPIARSDYSEFRKERHSRSKRSMRVFDTPISPIMSLPAARRSTRISMVMDKAMSEPADPSSVHCINGSYSLKRCIKIDADVPVKKLKASQEQDHYDGILEILNEGDLKKLTSLQTIGVKTAEQIILYRKLRGKFKVIEDVKNVLTRGKTYKRFLEANFLA